jgi:hypothetical protein
MASPTQEYNAYQYSYDYFNTHLFGGRLPPCLITFQRHPHARGYFLRLDIAARNNPTLRTNEIALAGAIDQPSVYARGKSVINYGFGEPSRGSRVQPVAGQRDEPRSGRTGGSYG